MPHPPDNHQGLEIGSSNAETSSTLNGLQSNEATTTTIIGECRFFPFQERAELSSNVQNCLPLRAARNSRLLSAGYRKQPPKAGRHQVERDKGTRGRRDLRPLPA